MAVCQRPRTCFALSRWKRVSHLQAALFLLAFLSEIWSCNVLASGTTGLGAQNQQFVTDERTLRAAIQASQSSGGKTHVIRLPNYAIKLTKPLMISSGMVVVLRGTASTAGPVSILQCGLGYENISLIEVKGTPNVTLSGLKLRGCTRPGVLLHPGSAADVTIDGCVFTNFTRTLEPGRVDITRPGHPTPISSSTAALALNASSFTGSLHVRNTTFFNNWFQMAEQPLTGMDETPTQEEEQLQLRRRRYALAAGQHGRGTQHGGRSQTANLPKAEKHFPQKGDGSLSSRSQQASSRATRTEGVRGVATSKHQQYLGRGQTTFPVAHNAGGFRNSGRRVLQQESGKRIRKLPTMDNTDELLLSYAAVLDPGSFQEGPWADDLEAVVAVTCHHSTTVSENTASTSTTSTCSVEFNGVKMYNNTGVATSGVYLMCDGMQRCDMAFTSCELRDNKLLWQGALDPENLPSPGPLANRDPLTWQFLSYGTGTELFLKMFPWLTYTYPIFYDWKWGESERGKLFLCLFNLTKGDGHYGSITDTDDTSSCREFETSVNTDGSSWPTDAAGSTDGTADGAEADLGVGDDSSGANSDSTTDGDAGYGGSAGSGTGDAGSATISDVVSTSTPSTTHDGLESSAGEGTLDGGTDTGDSTSGSSDGNTDVNSFEDGGDFDSSDGSRSDMGAENVTPDVPTLTGRTLGVVMIHQRNSPYPGVESNSPAMANVVISGGEYSGNDGAIFMNSATDWSRLAGGDGNWGFGDLPRHSVDYTISGVNVYDHTNGMPAIWLRWIRSAQVTNCTVVKSTGSIWLDEVRDSVTMDGCIFSENIMPEQKWLYYWGFRAWAPDEVPPIDSTAIGSGTFQVVLIQMTPLGQLDQERRNTVAVRNTVFDGNPSYVTGTLYITGADRYLSNKNNLPGKTFVTMENVNFTRNYCRRLPPGAEIGTEYGTPNKCLTGERPLYLLIIYAAEITNCRFEDNRAGAIYAEFVYSFMLNSCSFANNLMSFTTRAYAADRGAGGGALVGISLGYGGAIINNCNFINNTSPPGGGAIFLMTYFFAKILDSRFIGNTATYADGGAIYLLSNELNIQNVQLESNFEIISGCVFTRNTAGRSGGAIYGALVATSGATWTLNDNVFTENQANVAPYISQGMPLTKIDYGGGGAVYIQQSFLLSMFNNSFTKNRVLRHAGGGLRLVDIEGPIQMGRITFEDNVAVTGAAMSVSRANEILLSQRTGDPPNVFKNNSVVDPWAWPETSPVPGANDETLHFVSLRYLKPGFGGAIAIDAVDKTIRGFELSGATVFDGNRALYGGAIGITSCNQLGIRGEILPVENSDSSMLNLTVPSDVSATTFLPTASMDNDNYTIPYQVVFMDNTALLGGAVYVKDTPLEFKYPFGWKRCFVLPGDAERYDELIQQGYVVESLLEFAGMAFVCVYQPFMPGLTNEPTIIFFNNSGAGGGAMYIESATKVSLGNAAFLANRVSPVDPKTQSAESNMADVQANLASKPCFDGSGGAICIAGFARTTHELNGVYILGNEAYMDGGGVYIAEGTGCPSSARCYQVNLSNVTVSGNRALSGRGGAICWQNEGVLFVQACKADRFVIFPHDNNSANGQTGSAALRFPARKPPASWYKQLKTEYKLELLQDLGGLVSARSQGLYMENGYVDNSLMQSFISAIENVTSDIVVNDTVWEGMPHTQLACSDWSNNTAVAGGDDISTSPYFLVVKLYEPFYNSNTDFDVNVTIHDWYGNNFTGTGASVPFIVVRARPVVTVNGPLVIGATEIVAFNGTAPFKNLRLRAPAGPWDLGFYASVSKPGRELKPSRLTVFVRPCSINEYLDPYERDVCLPCDVGYYNLNSTKDSCSACPDGAECGYPGDKMGFLVPQDGNWHSNFFSDQILECPNEGSCERQNRTEILTRIQIGVWEAALAIQRSEAEGNASDPTNVTTETPSGYGRNAFRRILLEQGFNVSAEFLQKVFAATSQMLPAYMSSQCAEGYFGVLCGQCSAGYGWVNVATCVNCPDKALNSLYYACATLLTMVSLTLAIRASIGSIEFKLARAAEVRRRDSMQLRFSHKFDSDPHYEGIILEEGEPSITAARMEEGASGADMSPLRKDSPRRTSTEAHCQRLSSDDAVQRGEDIPAAEDLPDGPKAAAHQSPSVEVNAVGSTDLAPAAILALNDKSAQQSSQRFKPTVPCSGGEPAEVKLEVLPQSPIKSVVVPASISRENTRNRSQRQNSSFRQTLSHNGSQPLVSVFARVPKSQEEDILGTSSNTSESRANISTVFRIAISYLQVLALLSNIPVSFYNIVDIFLGVCNQATSYPGTLVSLDCSLSDDISISKAMTRVLLGAFAPLYTTVAFIILTIWASSLKYTWKRFTGRIPPTGVIKYCHDVLRRDLLVIITTIMFFFYPSVCQTLFSIFYCQDVTEYDMPSLSVVTYSVWQLDFGTKCYQGSHLALALALGVPGLLLFGLGWPILSAVLVVRDVRKSSERRSGNIKLTKNEENLADYNPRWIWWESVTLLRQLAIAAVVTFVGYKSTAGVQLLIIFFILVAAVVAHTVIRPYRLQFMGTMAILSLYGLMATVYLLLFLSQLGDDDVSGQKAVSIIVVVLNFFIISAFTWVSVQAYWFGLLESSGLSNLDPDTRRSLTYFEARNHILAHMSQIESAASSGRSSNTRRLSINNSAFERLSHVKRTSVAASRAAVVVLGNQIGTVFQQVRSHRRGSRTSMSGHLANMEAAPSQAIRTARSEELQQPLQQLQQKKQQQR